METLRAQRPLRVGAVTLVPVMRAAIRSGSGAAGCWITAVAEPVAIVMRDASGTRALAADRSEIALETLIAQTPNLEAILSGLSES